MAVRPCGTVCRCAREILIVPKRRRRVRDICDAGGAEASANAPGGDAMMTVVMTISMKTVIRMLMLMLWALVLRALMEPEIHRVV